MKSTLLLLTCALAVALAGSCGFATRAASAQDAIIGKSLTLGRGTEKQVLLRKSLGNKTELEFAETPLNESLAEISKKHGLDIQYDMVALRDAAIDPTAIPVSLSVKGISLRAAMSLILSQNNLSYVLRHEVLQITTKEKADHTLETVIYDIHDLAPAREGRRPNLENIENLVKKMCTAPSWSGVGGPGTLAIFGPASLIISQTEEVQEEVAWLLEELRKVGGQVKAGKTDDTLLYGRTTDNQRFQKALSENVELKFAETPLKEALEQIAKKYKLDIQYNFVALRDAAIHPTTIPVTLNARAISLDSALRLILSQNNLAIITRDEVLQVTTKDVADITLRTRVYPVGDLLKRRAAEGIHDDGDAAGGDPLTDLITTTIAAETWSDVGGPGVLETFEKDGVMLVMSQTDAVHDEVADLLAKLRIMRRNQIAAAVEEEAHSQEPETLVLKVYDLRASAPNAPAMTPAEVMEVVKGLVEPKSWTQPEVYIRGATGKLIVKQLPSVHRQVEKLLDELGAQVPKMPGASGGRGALGNPGGGGF